MPVNCTIDVELGERGYPIVIGSALLGGGFDLGEHLAGDDCLIVSNETVAPLYLERLLADLPGRQVASINLPDGEAYKTLQTASSVLDSLVAARANRDITVIALGSPAPTSRAKVGPESTALATAGPSTSAAT